MLKSSITVIIAKLIFYYIPYNATCYVPCSSESLYSNPHSLCSSFLSLTPCVLLFFGVFVRGRNHVFEFLFLLYLLYVIEVGLNWIFAFWVLSFVGIIKFLADKIWKCYAWGIWRHWVWKPDHTSKCIPKLLPLV